ncbi:MAG: VPLPA-CTERM sorting domain-containing protein [Pseudomonadota bacterium]
MGPCGGSHVEHLLAVPQTAQAAIVGAELDGTLSTRLILLEPFTSPAVVGSGPEFLGSIGLFSLDADIAVDLFDDGFTVRGTSGNWASSGSSNTATIAFNILDWGGPADQIVGFTDEGGGHTVQNMGFTDNSFFVTFSRMVFISGSNQHEFSLKFASDAPATVPLPAAAWMLLAGLAGIAIVGRRTRV